MAKKYDKYGYDEEGYDKDGYNRYGYDREGYGRDGYGFLDDFNREGIHRDTGTVYDKYGYDKEGYHRSSGFSRKGIHRDTGTAYNQYGYDKYGYDKEGYDREGYDREGYDKEGYSSWGYDRSGYDKDGYDKRGFDREGIHWNTGTAYNKRGYDRDGYDKKGYDEFGYDRTGYNEAGYTRDGYDREGNSRWDYDKEGYHRSSGFNRKGIHRDTGTAYNKYGYDKYGYDKEGYNSSGYDKKGYDRDGYDGTGYNKEGFNREGIHKETGTKYNVEELVENFINSKASKEKFCISNGIQMEYLEKILKIVERINPEIAEKIKAHNAQTSAIYLSNIDQIRKKILSGEIDVYQFARQNKGTIRVSDLLSHTKSLEIRRQIQAKVAEAVASGKLTMKDYVRLFSKEYYYKTVIESIEVFLRNAAYENPDLQGKGKPINIAKMKLKDLKKYERQYQGKDFIGTKRGFINPTTGQVDGMIEITEEHLELAKKYLHLEDEYICYNTVSQTISKLISGQITKEQIEERVNKEKLKETETTVTGQDIGQATFDAPVDECDKAQEALEDLIQTKEEKGVNDSNE